MNILVTGATGFIGGHLTEHLHNEGHNVTCFVRQTNNLRWLKNLPVLYKYVLEDLSHYDVIYHIAGVNGKSFIPLSTYREAHIELPKQILSNMSKHQKFVYMSSAWVYLPKHQYELTKLEGERVVEESKINHAIVRPGFVYGPRDFHHLPLYQWIKRLGRLFPIIGSGRNKLCPTYIDDVIGILLEAKELEGIVPVVGEPIILNEYISAIAEAVGAPRPLIHLPFGPKSDFFKVERVFPNVGEQTCLEEGLSTTVDWYEQNNLL